MEKRKVANTDAEPESLEAFKERYGPFWMAAWEAAEKVPTEVRIDAGATDTEEGFDHYYGPAQGPIKWAEGIPVPFQQWITYIYPPNALLMSDTQIAQSAGSRKQGAKKKALCREVIPSSCTAFAAS